MSNGSRLFAVAGLDGRTQTARRFRDLVEVMTNDLGGADLLSEAQRQLIRRAASLAIMAEAQEADMARNLAFDLNSYTILVNAQRRVFDTLGIERRAKPVNDGSNVLADYFSRPPPKVAAE